MWIKCIHTLRSILLTEQFVFNFVFHVFFICNCIIFWRMVIAAFSYKTFLVHVSFILHIEDQLEDLTFMLKCFFYSTMVRHQRSY